MGSKEKSENCRFCGYPEDNLHTRTVDVRNGELRVICTLIPLGHVKTVAVGVHIPPIVPPK